MKKFFLLLTLSFFITISNAQISAVTSKGDEVILNNDGTWKYLKNDAKEKKEINLNPVIFVKAKENTFPVISGKIPTLSIFLDPKSWSFKKVAEDAALEYNFQNKGKEIYALLITERIEVPLESLKEVALRNAKKVAPDVEIVSEEFRNVNGLKVLCMQLNGTIQGINFTYFGYYYTGKEGSIQFVSFTAQSLFKEYKKDMETLLNGFVVSNN